MLIIRGYRFLRRYLFSNPRYTIRYVLTFWRQGYVLSAHLLSEEEFVRELKNGRSVIRLGDGEINLMLGLRNHYQTFSSELKDAMFRIVRGYRAGGSYLLAVPRFLNFPNHELRAMGKLGVWMPFKVIFALHFDNHLPYLDAHSFYYDGYFERTVGAAIVKKHIVLVTNDNVISTLRVNRDIPWHSIAFVPAPPEESLSAYAAIKERIDESIAPHRKDELVLLFAAGPVGKLLAYEYASSGVQSIDVGRGIESVYSSESLEHLTV